jgi:hypothetical protein
VVFDAGSQCKLRPRIHLRAGHPRLTKAWAVLFSPFGR